jgi:integrase
LVVFCDQIATKIMAYIRTRERQCGTRYTVTVRRKGFRPVTATFDRKIDAETWAAQIEAEIKYGFSSQRPGEDIIFRELLNNYMTKVSPQKAETTQNRETQLARRLLTVFGDCTCDEITTSLVAAYRDARLKEVGFYTVRLELALLSHVFTIARREWNVQIDNPVSNIKRPKVPEGRLRFLSQDEAARLLAEARKSRNPTLYSYLFILLHSAMRPSEAAGIRCGQVDFNRRVVVLHKTKSGKTRSVPLTHAAVEVLKDLVRERDPGAYVFLPFSTLPYRFEITPARFFRPAFNNACKRAGIEDFRLHDMRHTAASYLLMAGVDLRTLAEILGHKTLAMVYRYTHVLDQHKLEAIDKIGKLGLLAPESNRDIT